MTAQYHVSDFLKDRHPYNAVAGFKEQAARDKTKLFDGFGQPSFQYNIEALMDPTIPVSEKSKALRSLLGHLTSADSKVRAIQCGLVTSLNWLVDNNLGSTVDELVCQAFRSLAVIPAGVFSLHRNEGLPRIITILQGRLEQPVDEAMLHAREAAGDAVQQLTFGWHARCLLLGEEVPEGMVGMAVEPADTPDVDEVVAPEERKEMGQQVVEALTYLIASYNAGTGISQRLLHSALQSLAHLSADAQGLDMCLVCGVLREVDELLRKFAEEPATWLGVKSGGPSSTEEVVYTAVTVVWNVCMDPVGKRKEESLTSLPFSLGKLLSATMQYPQKHMRLKAALAGAIATIFIYEEAKTTSIEPLFTGHDQENDDDIASVLFHLLREGNGMVDMIRNGHHVAEQDEKEEVARGHVQGAVKNAVQAIRLLTELPAVRTRVATLIAGDRALFNQLFCNTLIEQHMANACKWSP